MKKGLVSMTVVYSFLILFLLVILALLSSYMFRMKMVDNIIIDAKAELNSDSSGS